mmetsp:Transcript_7665/g.21629  ORF Transcript_7665/g.21629 Transcript_7665/m.21629 type:complete len:221 (-) Transcript_7665:139-801(-)
MCTPTSTCCFPGTRSTWIASSRSLAVAGSIVKIRLLCRSVRLFTSSSKELWARLTKSSTSSSCLSSNSRSCSMSSCSMSACFSSAARSPALPTHSPFSLPSGRMEVSFQVTIWIGQSLYLSSFSSGMPRTLRVTSFIWIKIQGIRLSVGFAFKRVSSSFTLPSSLRSLGLPSSLRGPLLSLGWSVHTITRPVPFGSKIATIFAFVGRSEFPCIHCGTLGG